MGYYVFLMYIFKCMVCTNAAPGFIFCVLNVLSLIYVGDKSGRNDLKVTGGVFLRVSVKCDVSGVLLLILIKKFVWHVEHE